MEFHLCNIIHANQSIVTTSLRVKEEQEGGIAQRGTRKLGVTDMIAILSVVWFRGPSHMSKLIKFCILNTPHVTPQSFGFFLFRATPATYGSSQARGQTGAAAASLHHGHSHTRSKLHLRPTPQLVQCWILPPLSEARDQTHIFTDTVLGS